MPEYWADVLSVVNSILLDMPYHGLILNERYLHHGFSHRLQCARPNLMDLLGPTTQVRLHPEWPTYKEATGIDRGKYRNVDGRYLPVDTGKKGGFIDFALGPYLAPEIAVEFKFLFGWQAEPLVFDYIKLLDGRNPFTAVVQVAVLMRPNGLAAAGRKDDIHGAINSAYQEAVRRLGVSQCRPDATRLQRFVVTELGPEHPRHWYNGGVGGTFIEGGEVPLLPE